LLASLPRLDQRTRDQRLHRIKGQPPSLIHLPPGCSFNPRCPYAEIGGVCSRDRPELRELSPSHWSACHFAETLDERGEVNA
jgi:peptide/nickel transport system ATP-binding protein